MPTVDSTADKLKQPFLKNFQSNEVFSESTSPLNLILTPLNYYLSDSVVLLVLSEQECDPDCAERGLCFCETGLSKQRKKGEKSSVNFSALIICELLILCSLM